MQPDGSTSEVTFSPFMKRRLSNGDETHQKLSNVGDKGGPRVSTFINPLLKNCGSRKVESTKHITSYVMVNGANEVRRAAPPSHPLSSVSKTVVGAHCPFPLQLPASLRVRRHTIQLALTAPPSTTATPSCSPGT